MQRQRPLPRHTGRLRLGATGFALGLSGAASVVLNLDATWSVHDVLSANHTRDVPSIASLVCATVLWGWSVMYAISFLVSVIACRARFNFLRASDTLASGPLMMSIALIGSVLYALFNGYSLNLYGHDAALPSQAMATGCSVIILFGFTLQMIHMCFFTGHVFHQWRLFPKRSGQRRESKVSTRDDGQPTDEARSQTCGTAAREIVDAQADAVRLPEPKWFPCTVGVGIICLACGALEIGSSTADVVPPEVGERLLQLAMYLSLAWNVLTFPVSITTKHAVHA